MYVHSTYYENEEDYKADLAWEYRKDGPNDPYYQPCGCIDCSCYMDCCKLVREEGYPQCEQGIDRFEEEYEEFERNNNGQN